MSTPSITPAQLVALAGAALGVLVAAGISLRPALRDAILELVTVLAPVIVLADAHIRHGRARIAAAQISAGAPTATPSSTTPAIAPPAQQP